MSTPAAKRRRIDAATYTLSKPFRSPFKTPLNSPDKNADTTLEDKTTTNKSTVLAPNSSNQSLLKLANPVISSKPTAAPPTQNPRTKKTFSSPIAAAAINADSEIAPLLRAQRELEKHLKEVKEELETAEQARKIEAESYKKVPDGEIDGELVELIAKWKNASRQAAEELFGKVRDRVNRMGGPRAWKEAQKKQQEYQNGWDQEEQQQNHDGSDDEEKRDVEKRDLYAEYDIDTETENEKSQRAKGVGDTGELPGQEDEFTMAMMLRTLNVDLDIVGYDRQQQRWID